MFKLKIIDKPELFKMKCNFEFPKIPIENLQEKEIDPTTKKQEIVPDKEYSALSKVTVNAVTSDIDRNILSKNIRSGVEILGVAGWLEPVEGEEITITPTKNTQIIKPSEGKNAITKATVNPYVPIVDTKTITENGTYKASDDNLDGYSQVIVETSGVDINDYFDLTKKNDGVARTYIKKFPLVDTSSYTSLSNFFESFYSLEEIPLLNTSKVTNMNRFCGYCRNLKIFPQLDTSKVTSMNEMFSNNWSLQEIPLLDCSKVVQMSSTFWYINPGVKLGGFLNYGQAFLTSASANYTNYTLDISQGHNLYFATETNLTHDSLMNVINNLYDIATKGVKTQQLIIGSNNTSKLTADEIAVATTKGFSVS